MTNTKTTRLQQKPETKGARLQLLIRPSVKMQLKAIAQAEGISINELANIALELYVDKRIDLINLINQMKDDEDTEE